MIEKLACKLGRNDEVPNIELAEALCAAEDAEGIGEIAEGLTSKDKAVANDCIKVLYEIGVRKPRLIAAQVDDFLSLLTSRNNRLVWGSMTALATIADLVPDAIYEHIDRVLEVFHNGSVIAVDNSVTVLAKLCKASKAYERHLLPILFEHLQECRPKEVPQHTERMSVCITEGNAAGFLNALDSRKEHLTAAQNARIKKLIKSMVSARTLKV